MDHEHQPVPGSATAGIRRAKRRLKVRTHLNEVQE